MFCYNKVFVVKNSFGPPSQLHRTMFAPARSFSKTSFLNQVEENRALVTFMDRLEAEENQKLVDLMDDVEMVDTLRCHETVPKWCLTLSDETLHLEWDTSKDDLKAALVYLHQRRMMLLRHMDELTFQDESLPSLHQMLFDLTVEEGRVRESLKAFSRRFAQAKIKP